MKTKKRAKPSAPVASVPDEREQIFGLVADLVPLGMPPEECGGYFAEAWRVKETAPLGAELLMGYGIMHAVKNGPGFFFKRAGREHSVIIVADTFFDESLKARAVLFASNFIPTYTEGLRAAKRIRWLPILHLRGISALLAGEIELAKREGMRDDPLILFYAAHPSNREVLNLDFVKGIGEKIFDFVAVDSTRAGAEGVGL